MFFILPFRTSIRPRRTPYVNYGLIILNFVIFAASMTYVVIPQTGERVLVLRSWAQIMKLTPVHPEVWQFVTYAFLHGNYMHIIGNMFFLYVFGRNVNDKLGNIGYLSFYLAGAVFSGLGHSLLSSTPVIGASGAVAAVTGAYLVLYPKTLITVFYWFFYIIDTADFLALYFIALKLILWDNVIERGMADVAYDAHLWGYATGMLSMLAMLALGLLRSDTFDLWAMLKHRYRRYRYQSVVAKGYDPFNAMGKKKVKAREVKKKDFSSDKAEHINGLRRDVSKRVSEKNISAAANTYLELIKLDAEYIPNRQNLLDIANQLASENYHTEAAAAYEKFISNYESYEYLEQVQLMLGLIYARYLDKNDQAVQHLETALKKLSDVSQVKMCKEELEKLKK